MKILNNDIDVDVIGFGALNVDKLHTVGSIAGKDEESFIKSQNDTPGGSAANTIIGLSRLGKKTSIIGKIGEDQLKDYANRRKLPVDVMRKFLSANL